MPLVAFAVPAILAAFAGTPDRVTVTLPVDAANLLEGGVPDGRVILFLKSDSARSQRSAPTDAPSFEDPQPMYSMAASRLAPGSVIRFGPDAIGFPVPIEELSGHFQIQAVFDRDQSDRTHMAPGNLISEIVEVDFDPEREDTVALQFSRRLPPREPLPADAGVEWVELKSTLLSAALGRDEVMRAGIVLPRRYHDLRSPRRVWPVIYVIPGFGGRHTMALQYARLVATERSHLIAPQVIWVILDPETALGHHGFADGEVHGPRARALVEEFIPFLESTYRIVPTPEARILTGHSSGGWSALWLQLTHPETFGVCFASAPDPVDFSAFQGSDLYHDTNLFVDANGERVPSYRAPLAPGYDRILMTATQEAAMERVLGPDGESGQQWDAWNALFSRVDLQSKRARRMFDPTTGVIDRAVVDNDWSRFDISRKVDRDWSTLGPIVISRVRLLCGDRDSFYLDRAVARLRDLVARRRAESLAAGVEIEGLGYIELVPGATHGSLPAQAQMRWNTEIRDYLRSRGLAE